MIFSINNLHTKFASVGFARGKLKEAEQVLSMANSLIAKDIRLVQGVLRALLPRDNNFSLSVSRLHNWQHSLVPVYNDTLAYVCLTRRRQLWEYQVRPVVPVDPTPDEYETIHQLEVKIKELGFNLNHDLVTLGGNYTIWSLSL